MKTLKFWKIFLSIFLGVLLAGVYALVVASTKVHIAFLEKFDIRYLYFACPAIALLLSLCFLNFKNRKLLLTLALAMFVVADLFLVLALIKGKNNLNIGLYVLCGAQLFFALYVLSQSKSIGMVICNLAVRVALCLIVYIIVPKYVALNTTQLIYLMYLANSAVTLLSTLLYIRTNVLFYIGYVILFLADLLFALSFGFATVLHLSTSFLELLSQFDFYFLFKVLGLFVISLATVWQNAKQN